MVKRRIGVIFGGRSAEHDVSLKSASSVIRALDRKKFSSVCLGITREGAWKEYKGVKDNSEGEIFDEALRRISDGRWEAEAESFSPCKIKERVDFVLPVLHGPYGEDGRIQGFLDTLGIPYGGCGVAASAAAMDKCLFKRLMEREGLPVCGYECMSAADAMDPARVDEAERRIGYPCFVKPANMGSSVGISKASGRAELEEALRLAADFDSRLVIEEYVPCRELEVAALGNGRPLLTDVGEILCGGRFYDYGTKYSEGREKTKLLLSAPLSPRIREEIKEMAARAYEAIGACGFARIDFFFSRDTGKIYLNEINTIPGFTENSMFPLLWQAAGLEYGKIIERIIELGYERSNAENNGKTGIRRG